MGSKTHTVGDVLDKYQKDVSPKKRGSRWEILRLELIGRKEIEGKLFRDIRLIDLKPQHITAWRDALGSGRWQGPRYPVRCRCCRTR
ncbi:hypothetical protein ACU4GD_27735 [Cupriavidus basilensis]